MAVMTDVERKQLEDLRARERAERIERLAQSAGKGANSVGSWFQEKFDKIFDTPEKKSAAKWALGAMAVVGVASYSPLLAVGALAYGGKMLYDKAKEAQSDVAAVEAARAAANQKAPQAAAKATVQQPANVVDLRGYGVGVYDLMATKINSDVVQNRQASIAAFDTATRGPRQSQMEEIREAQRNG